MAFFKKKREKKALILTVIINVALVLALFFFGMSYMEPPEENGIAVNLGDADLGSGEIQPNTPVKTAPKEKSALEETDPKPEKTPENNEEAVTQNTEEAPVINEDEEKEETEKESEEETQTEEESEEEEEEDEPEQKEEPKPEESTTEAIQNVVSGKEKEGERQKGEGPDDEGGDKGNPEGEANASSYYGQGKGLDGDGNYRLGGRKALNKKKYEQDCNESGTVVVQIKVNREGKVVKADPGVKGTTNTSSCLLEPAKKAALDTEFNSDADAPSVQTGLIIYEFKLSD